MLQSIIMRVGAGAIWVLAAVLTYTLISEFTEGQSDIIWGLALMAFMVSSVSLVMSRWAFRRKDGLTAWAALGMYALGFVVMAFFESGFWVSSISNAQHNVARAEAAQSGVDLLRRRQQDALRSGNVAETSAEIQAKMDVQLAQPVGNQPLSRLTNGCTDTSSTAFRLCGEYLELKAKHAKALRIEEIEEATWKNGTSIEMSKTQKNIFAGATAFAQATGWSTPEAWATVFSFLLVSFLTIVRDTALIILFAPLVVAAAGALSAPSRAKPADDLEWTETEFTVKLPREPAKTERKALGEESVRQLEDRLAKSALEGAGLAAPEAPTKPRTPTPGGGPKKTGTAETPASAPAADARGQNVVSLPVTTEMFEEPAKHRKTRSKAAAKGRAVAWLDERTERVQDLNVVCSHDDAWADYREWCQDEELRQLPKATFIRAVRAQIGSVSNGFIGLVLCEQQVEERAQAWG